MKVFLINLDRSRERLEFMQAQLSAQSISYTRVPACDGAAMSNQEIREKYSRTRTLLAHGCDLSRGEIGCALSHLRVYRSIIANKLPYALIIEDDIILDKKFKEVAEEAEKAIDATKPQVFLLSYLGRSAPGNSTGGFKRVSTAACTDCYLITSNAAEILADVNYPIKSVADNWSEWSRRFGLELYQSLQPVVKQENCKFGSIIDGWTGVRPRIKGKGFFAKILWKSWRVLGRFADWLIWRIVGK